MKTRNMTLFTAIAAAAALAPAAQAATIVGSYQYVFVTSGQRTPSDVATINAFVQAAANGGSVSGPLGLNWTVIASFADGTNANVNALVEGPVYRLDNVKVADDYADMWDGSLDAAIRVDENGDDASVVTWTGSLSTGVGDDAGNDYRLNTSFSEERIGRSGNTDTGWIQAQAWSNQNAHFYALSEVIPEPATMSLLAIGGIALLRRKRRA